MQTIDITGQRFGKLTVIERVPHKPNSKGATWRCVCDCGNEKVLLGVDLRLGRRQSCGCLRKDNINQIRLQYIQNDPDWQKKKKAQKSTQCPYNEGVECVKKVCWRCGFNPKVAKVRTEKFMEGYHG